MVDRAEGGSVAGSRPSGNRRDSRAPISAFVAGQEVLAWHRVNGWRSAVVATVRDDGKYFLNWVDGDETDRIKTRTNLRKGVKDQLKTSSKSSPGPGVLCVGVLRDEGMGMVATGVVGDGADMTVDGVKVGVGETVISGGEVVSADGKMRWALSRHQHAEFAGGGIAEAVEGAGEGMPHQNSADLAAHGGGIKSDQDALAAAGMNSMGKRERKRSVDGEWEDPDPTDMHSGHKGAVPPALSAGGWSKSEHIGLMSMWFQQKRWYHCELCDYLNDRLYHSKMHYERIHVKKGKQQFHKRKHTNMDLPPPPPNFKDDGKEGRKRRGGEEEAQRRGGEEDAHDSEDDHDRDTITCADPDATRTLRAKGKAKTGCREEGKGAAGLGGGKACDKGGNGRSSTKGPKLVRVLASASGAKSCKESEDSGVGVAGGMQMQMLARDQAGLDVLGTKISKITN